MNYGENIRMYNTTTNGALQHESSGNKCLDLFSVIGNLRNCSRTDVLERFEQAFNENPKLATRVAHWAREPGKVRVNDKHFMLSWMR